MNNKRAIAYLFLVFVLGAALGVLGTLWASRSGWALAAPPGPPSMRDKAGAATWLTHELDLTAEQQQQLGVILDETASNYESIRDRVRPEYDQVRQTSRDKIRAILTLEQKARFEELVRQMDEERARRRRGRDKGSR